MTRALRKRIDTLEAISKPVIHVPHVLHVRRNETTAEARSRFAAMYPDAQGHWLLVVPARDRTAEDEADFALKFEAQQLQIIADAGSRH